MKNGERRSIIVSRNAKQHYFLSKDHAESEKKTWIVIILCTASMIIEIVCGVAFGSLALVADGLHMSTHATAFFIAAMAYSYARKHADNPKFVFSTGKVGDLAAYTSAIILGIIGCIILYDGVNRLIYPEKVNYKEAIPVAFVGLSVNVSSGLIFMGFGDSLMNYLRGEKTSDASGQTFNHAHGHGHSHGHQIEHYEVDDNVDADETSAGDKPSKEECSGHDHGHGHHHDHAESVNIIRPVGASLKLSIFEEGSLPVFRLETASPLGNYAGITVTTLRDSGSRQTFRFKALSQKSSSSVYESTESIPEPHEFTAELSIASSGIMAGTTAGTGTDGAAKAKEEFYGVKFVEGSSPTLYRTSESSSLFQAVLTDDLMVHDHGDGFAHSHDIENFHSHDLSSHALPVQGSSGKVHSDHGHGHGHDHGHFDSDTDTVFNALHAQAASSLGGHDHAHQSSGREHGDGHDHGHGHSHDCARDHDHGHGHGHDHGENEPADHHDDHDHGHGHDHGGHDSSEHGHNPNKKLQKHEVDLNIRAAIIHVVADAVVSVLVIVALIVAGTVPGCGFLDPLMGIIGSLVIMNWSYTLVVDTTANLLDLMPDPKLVAKLKKRLESDGSIVTDLHVWRLGPGHLGAIMSISPPVDGRTEAYYNSRIKGFRALSHVTIEIGPTSAQ